MNFSPQLGFIVFRVILPILLISMQYMLYKRAAKWLKTTYPDAKWGLYITRVLFVVFNAAALYLFIERPRTAELPEWFMYTGVYPFAIWHGGTFFVALFVLFSSLIKLPFKLTVWTSKRFTAPKRKSV